MWSRAHQYVQSSCAVYMLCVCRDLPTIVAMPGVMQKGESSHESWQTVMYCWDKCHKVYQMCMEGHCCACRAWEAAFLPTFLTSMWNSTWPMALYMSLMMRLSLTPGLGAALWLGYWICQQKTCIGENKKTNARLHLRLSHLPDISALLTHGWNWHHCVLVCVRHLQWNPDYKGWDTENQTFVLKWAKV